MTDLAQHQRKKVLKDSFKFLNNQITLSITQDMVETMWLSKQTYRTREQQVMNPNSNPQKWINHLSNQSIQALRLKITA